MLGKIKYSYIPQTKATDAILSSLAYAIKSTGGIDYILIDNKSKGRRIYPDDMSDNVINCHKDELVEQIESLAENDTEIILVNGFDINLDEVREKFCKLVKSYDILLCINNILDLEDNNSNISIYIEPNIDDLDDEEWADVKEEIIYSLEEAQEQRTLKEKNKNKNKDKESGMTNLLELFGLNNLNKKADMLSTKRDDTKDEYIYDEFDLDVVEQYSYTVNDSELIVSLSSDDEILINNEEDFILIPKKQVQFLIDTLVKLQSVSMDDKANKQEK